MVSFASLLDQQVSFLSLQRSRKGRGSIQRPASLAVVSGSPNSASSSTPSAVGFVPEQSQGAGLELMQTSLQVLSGIIRGARGMATSKPAPVYLEQEKWWTTETLAVVTGSNKGIGYWIARGLADAGVLTVLTSRNPELGQQALAKLKGEGRENVVFHQLDITSQGSIDAFAKWLEKEYHSLDILVNNAGFAYKGNIFGAQEAKTTIATNYSGTRAVTEALLPLLRSSPNGARVVNVSSRAGLLKIVSSALQKRFPDPSLSLPQLDALGTEFVSGIEKGTFKEEGWPASMYGVSKLMESAYTRVLAREMGSRSEGQRVFVNACCPGYCATDMSSNRGTKTAEEGADTPIYLALLPAAKAKSGLMWAERNEISF